MTNLNVEAFPVGLAAVKCNIDEQAQLTQEKRNYVVTGIKSPDDEDILSIILQDGYDITMPKTSQ